MSIDQVDSPSRTVEIDEKLTHLREAFRAGRTMSLKWRIAQLEGLLRFVDECDELIAEAIRDDLGRDPMATFMADTGPLRKEIRHTIDRLPKWAGSTPVSISAATAPGKAWTTPEPKGVVLVLGTWNFPVLLTVQPIVSAIAAGNNVLLKPSDAASSTADLLATQLPRYVDSAAVQVVLGDGDINRELLTRKFDHTFFTGSTHVGRAVMEASAKHLTPVTLELGGKSPVIVTRDANIPVAARRIAWAKAINAGQTCIAPDYVLVEDCVRAELVERLLEELPERGSYDSTRIVNRRQFDRIQGLLSSHGGEQYGGLTNAEQLRVDPALVTDPDLESDLMREEIFGPILPLIGVPDLDSAIEFINDRPKPLALYLFTESRRTEAQVLERTSSGAVGINHLLYHLLVPELPFGGVGDSGFGRYHGKFGFDTFSHDKAVLRKPSVPDPSAAYPPYNSMMRSVLRKVMG